MNSDPNTIPEQYRLISVDSEGKERIDSFPDYISAATAGMRMSSHYFAQGRFLAYSIWKGDTLMYEAETGFDR